MKEEITEYQPAEDTVTRVQCDGCTTTWDDRSDDECNHVMLDATIERKSFDGWDSKSYKWNSTSLSSMSANRMAAVDTAEYCDTCWSGFFTTGHAVEVTESEYYVEEETTEEYYCDFCGDGMGESVDREVSVNPRIEKEKEKRGHNVLTTERKTVAIVRELGESVTCGTRGRKYAKRDDDYDCCHSCAREIFDRHPGPGFVRQVAGATARCTADMCKQIKDIMLLNGV